MSIRTTLRAGLLFAFVASGATAQSVTKTYVLLASGQGAGSTAFAALLGSALVAQYDAAGVVVAASSDPNFQSWAAQLPGVQAVAEDVEIQWISPEEQSIEVTEDSLPTANNEPFSALQWNLHQIHADETAANGDRGNGVARARVAVVDSGIVTNHEDIASNLNLGLSRSFVPTEPNLDPPNNNFNHGTHVAGIVAAPINGKGVQGVAPEAEIVAVKVLRASGSGTFASVIAGIDYASGPDVHADVINMSLGAFFLRNNAGGGGLGPLISALNRVINQAEAQGTLVVSAAGNSGIDLNGPFWEIPAQSGHGMAVSATGPIGFGVFGDNAVFDRLASYSNFGQSVINVAAPGGDHVLPGNSVCTVGPLTRPCFVFDFVLSPGGKGNRYFFAIGTSMATPHVSGVAALIVGKFGHMNPAHLRQIIQNSSDQVMSTADEGRGRINALRALQ